MNTLTEHLSHRPLRRGVRASLVVVLAILALAAASLVVAPIASAVEDVQPARVEGPTRLETAVATAERAYPEGSDEVVVGPSDDFTHTLAGAALAGALDAPMLLTPPDLLADTTADALRTMGAERVTLLGGPAAITSDVEDELAEDYAVTRVGDDDPYESAANIAQTTRSIAGGLPELGAQNMPTVALASGSDFPDALSISGPANDGAIPLLLTDPTSLPEATRDALVDLDPEHVIAIGGPDAISDDVLDEIEGDGRLTTRLGGINRTDTAAIVADWFLDAGWFEDTTAILAAGDAFPDAVTAGQLSGQLEAPILLTANRDLLGEQAGSWFTESCPTLEVLQIVGGPEAVSVDVANGAEGLAESCADNGDGGDDTPAVTQTYTVTPQQALSTEAPGVHDFTLARRYDGEPIDGPLDLVLFPCENADVTGSDVDTFVDADNDGDADGFATTDTGRARIAQVNGVDVDDSAIFLAEVDEDGDIDVRLASQSPDCTVLVVVDGNGNGALDLDANGTPVEKYGVGKAEWT
ncbi:MAG: cell wall-binding repeat-containing protein [Actinomycetota bacterium]